MRKLALFLFAAGAAFAQSAGVGSIWTVVTGTLQSSAVANGNGTTLGVGGLSSVVLTVNCAACSGGTTVNFEATQDGTNFGPVFANLTGASTIATSTAAAGLTYWQIPLGGWQTIRARVSAYSAGTVTVTASATAAPYVAQVINSNDTQTGTWTVQPGNTANTTAWKVDGSGVVQPVSGTVTTSPPANASTNVAQIAGTAADTNSGTKSAGTLRVVLATDQPALTNKLLVTPDSVALPANQSVNVAQVAGTTTDTNSGTKSAGTQRVVLATDQPALTNKLLVTADPVSFASPQAVTQSGTWTVQPGNTANTTAWKVDNSAVTQPVSGTFWQATQPVSGTVTTSPPANASTNVAQVAGATTSVNNGTTDTGTQRVTLSSDSTGQVKIATGSNSIGAVTQAAGPWTTNPTQWAGTTLGTITNYGTTPGGVAVPAVNAYVTSAPSNTDLLTQLVASVNALKPNPFAPPLKVAESFPAPTFDPCNGPNRMNLPVSTSANVQLIAGQAGKTFHFCQGGFLVVTTAGSFSIVEGTGATCGTGTLAMIGATTAANGMALAANGGFLVQGGRSAIPGNSVCLLLTGTGLIAGNVEYAY